MFTKPLTRQLWPQGWASVGTPLKSLENPYHAGLHRFAIFTACVTLVLIVAGALVTSNDAGLSIPDWPRSYGYFTRVPQWVGGIRYEFSHRVIAGSVAVLTLLLAGWTLLVERRKWLRWLAVGALCTWVAQAVLGGLTVLLLQPPAVSSAHATVAQTFFCIAVLIAMFTGRSWIEEHPRVEPDSRRPSLITLTLLSVFVLYVQLILGAMFRHHGMSWWPHVIHAAVVAIVLSWTAVRAMTVYPNIAAVRRPSVAMLGLMVAQLCFGFLAFITRVLWGQDAPQPELPMILATVVHVAVGALLLAATVVLAVQVWRNVPVSFEERVPGGERKPVIA